MSSSTTKTTEGVIACPECDYLHRVEELPAGAKALCVRCAAVLYRHIPRSLERATALYAAALLLFLLANAFPIIALDVGGRVEQTHLISAAGAFLRHDMAELGVLVFLTSVLFPLVTIAGTLYVLLAVQAGWRAPGRAVAYRLVRAVAPWSLVGVFMLGLLVAVVKLLDLATVVPGVSLYAYAGLLVVVAAASANLDEGVIWPRLHHPGIPLPSLGSARQHGLVGCHVCALVSPADVGASCPRCASPLHARKHDAIVRTWALVVSAALLFIPANLYPVMTVTRLGRGEPNTILSGVVELIANGMWPLALLVFFASIVVPVAKLGVLSFLLVSVQRSSPWRPRDRTLLFRVTEVVGAWSMVDVFLVAILAALVRMDALALVVPGIGVTFFAAVVVLTMLAAHSFDPRLIWDHAEPRP
ncbi:MAG: paraquat-inducible protein A [Gammaproteobacteria bacterium]|nr:paraquat-inducible protein A [Gammaproteobacteria bacterium]